MTNTCDIFPGNVNWDCLWERKKLEFFSKSKFMKFEVVVIVWFTEDLVTKTGFQLPLSGYQCLLNPVYKSNYQLHSKTLNKGWVGHHFSLLMSASTKDYKCKLNFVQCLLWILCRAPWKLFLRSSITSHFFPSIQHLLLQSCHSSAVLSSFKLFQSFRPHLSVLLQCLWLYL